MTLSNRFILTIRLFAWLSVAVVMLIVNNSEPNILFPLGVYIGMMITGLAKDVYDMIDKFVDNLEERGLIR